MQINTEANINRKKIVLISLIAVVLCILGALSAIMLISGTSEAGTIKRGVSVCGIDLSLMDKESAIDALKAKAQELNEKSIPLAIDGQKAEIKVSDMNVKFLIEETVEDALEVGKEGRLIKRILENLMPNKNIEFEIEMLDEDFKRGFSNAVSEFETPLKETEIIIEDDKAFVVKGKSGVKIDYDEAKERIEEEIEKATFNVVELNAKYVKPENISAEDLYEKYCKDFADAKYEMVDGEIIVTEGVIGLTFDKDALGDKMSASDIEGEKIEIEDAVVTMPEHTKEELEGALFRDVLKEYKTTYSTGDVNRSSNIALAAKSIDGTILMPNDVFSFNTIVGERTAANGYKIAHAYSNGETIDQLGGGICQVSSTLYNAALYSDLKIESRRNHQMTVAYVPLGQDATVDYGTQDFKFRNNTNYPIKIKAYAEKGKMVASIIGTTVDESMKVEIVSNIISEIEPYKVKESIDPSLPAGESKVTKEGSKGYVVETYRIVYSNGQEVRRDKLGKSTYNPTTTEVSISDKILEIPPEEIVEEVEKTVDTTEETTEEIDTEEKTQEEI